MSEELNAIMSVDSLPATRSIASTAVTTALPQVIVDELGCAKCEQLTSAKAILQRFFNAQQISETTTTATAARELFSAPAHTAAIAALKDTHSTLEALTTKSGVSLETRCAVWTLVLDALLTHSACGNFFQQLCFPVLHSNDVTGPAVVMAAIDELELMARTVEVMLNVVDGSCAMLYRATLLDTDGTRSQLSHTQLRLWCQITAHAEAIMLVCCVGLRSTPSGACRWGAVVHAGIVRMLEALLQTASALLSLCQRDASTKVEEEDAELLASTRCFGQLLTTNDVLDTVAQQLELTIQVLEETDPLTRKAHICSYDVLRHGPLLTVEEVHFKHAFEGRSAPTAASARTPWTPQDGTRRRQSPLELYACAVAFLSRAAAARIEFALSPALSPAVGVPVWRGYVRVLERALQEGETALTATPPPPLPPRTSPAASPTTATEAAQGNDSPANTDASLKPVQFASPLLPRVRCGEAGAELLTSLPPSDDNGLDSDTVTPCQSPVGRCELSPGTMHRGSSCSPAAVARQQNVQTSASAASGRRSLDFPAFPAAAEIITSGSFPTDACATTLAAAAVGGTDTHSSPTAQDLTDTTDAAGSNAPPLPPSGDVREPCGGEDSLRSTDITTVAGMTDAETLSLCGDSYGATPAALRTHLITVNGLRAAAAVIRAPSPRGGMPLCSAGQTARTASLLSAGDSPTRRAAVSAGHAQEGIPSPRWNAQCKSAASPANASVAALRFSAMMEPLALPAPAVAAAATAASGALRHGSSKSSCLHRDVQPKRRSARHAAFVCPTPVLRTAFPTHACLTHDVLAALINLTRPTSLAVESMIALVDAKLLSVLAEMMEFPSSTLQEVVTATLENCFAFWESVVATQPLRLCSPHISPFGENENTAASTPQTMTSAERPADVDDAAALPPPLRAFLFTFSTFLGWDGEGWAALHAQYLQRALRLLITMLDYIKDVVTPARPRRLSPSSCATASAVLCSQPSLASPRLLDNAIHYLLRSGVIAHVWRCLSMDATQIPGAMGRTSAGAATSTAAAGRRIGAQVLRPAHSLFEAMPAFHYGVFSYNSPSAAECAVLSEAQCTAMTLLYTLAKSLDWTSATRDCDDDDDVRGTAGKKTTTQMPTPRTKHVFASSRAAAYANNVCVPATATYHAFMAESFKHLPACATCLRRCTYTRSQSRPIAADELEALSRVLNVLRILFAAMEAGPHCTPSEAATSACTASPNSAHATPSFAVLRQTWAHQIVDSQVLDVLAHIGTAAELVSFPLPRLCVFTLRSYLEHVHVLHLGLSIEHRPFTNVKGPSPSAKAVARVRVSVSALQALVTDPPPLPVAAGASTWGQGTVRESLLVILLARMQRRCAGQSPNASVSLRLEVFALLLDVLTPLVETLPSSLTGSTARSTFANFYDAITMAELLRMAQRVVAAVIGCRVWSGTAQEVRYLDTTCTTPVKDSLRFLHRVAQLVNGSTVGFLRAADAQAASAEAGALGRRTASVLLAESNTVTFGFHMVTMDFPLALAGLINGTRWQMTTTTTATAKLSGASPTSSRSSTSGSSGRRSATSSSSSAPSSLRSAVVTMTAPAPPLIARRVTESAVFDNEDRRDVCEIAACALAELLCSLRRVELLLMCPEPLRMSTLLCATPLCRSGGDDALRRLSSVTASTSVTSGGSSGAAAVPPQPSSQPSSPYSHRQQVDVVVVQDSGASFAGLVTSTLYPSVISALADTVVVVADALAPAAPQTTGNRTATPAVEAAPSPTSTSSPSSPSANTSQSEDENPRNWRQAEQLWRRRLPLIRTTQKDALHALDLDMLDRYLNHRRRYAAPVAAAVTSIEGEEDWEGRDVEMSVAEDAVTVLAGEKKRYLEDA